MNKINNKRKKESTEKIKKIFVELIQTKELHEISVSDICKKANLNRTTFYSNYIDIYDLADKIKAELFEDVVDLYKNDLENGKKHSYDFLKLFKHIKENQLFYKTYFKLDYHNDNIDFFEKMIDYNEFEKYYKDKKHLMYHVTFFKYGFNAVIQKWLHFGCKETPEEIMEIIVSEYKNKS